MRPLCIERIIFDNAFTRYGQRQQHQRPASIADMFRNLDRSVRDFTPIGIFDGGLICHSPRAADTRY